MASTDNMNGLLAIPASVTGKKGIANSSAPNVSSRSGFQSLRLLVRRLPPGLSQAEFEEALGNDWRVGQGRVDWFVYKDGKISKDPAKPSRPARAYLRVRDQALLDSLLAVIKQYNIQDAKNTSKDPCLLGPPSLEFAPYGRVPSSRVRRDGRQGTIDQDPEFIDFLHSLTEPVTRPNANGEGTEGTDTKPAKVTMTPLVEFLRDKKANKGKEVPTPKITKPKIEAKEAKVKTEAQKLSPAKEEAVRQPGKAKAEKGAEDAVKAVNNSAAALKVRSDAPESAYHSSQTPATKPTTVRKRGSASVAARILQRDLGLAAKSDRRAPRGANPESKAPAGAEPERGDLPSSLISQSSTKAPEPTTPTAVPEPSTSKPIPPAAPPSGPRAQTPVPPTQPDKRPGPVPRVRPSRPPPTPSAGATSAFLKYAYYSQGVTKELLHSAFSVFGAITRCEIDQRKGFGCIDFEDTESLKQAMLASPVKVGNKGGQVVVLENKNFKSKPQALAPPPAPAVSESNASTQSQTPLSTSPLTEVLTEAPTASATTAAPTTPRGAHVSFRGGGQHRSHRGGYIGPPRGAFTRGGRGGRANFRGRGGLDSNRSTGHTNSKGSSGSPTTAPSAPPTSVPQPTTDTETNGATE